MNDNAIAIMNAAEKRMRKSGFNGFSFREIAEDVGVKSSSVHYHFPTKEALAAAVIRRYSEEVTETIRRGFETESDPIKVWTQAFRGTIHSKGKICPCAVLGASSRDLPREVAAEIKAFFQMCVDTLVEKGLSPNKAAEVLAIITGAMVVTNALGDPSHYDRATSELLRGRQPTR